MMPSTIRILRCFVVAIVITTFLSRADNKAIAADATVAQLDQMVANKKLEDAIVLARQLDERPDVTTDLTLPLARLARELQKAKELDSAAEFYQRAVDALSRPAAAKLDSRKQVLVRLAAGSVLTQSGKLHEAVGALRPAIAAKSPASDSQRAAAVTICLRIGATALATGAVATASEAYSVALSNAKEDQIPTAMLGDAWATAVGSDRPLEAAKKLAAFIDQYPKHADASRASRACAECLKQAGRDEDATAMLADLLLRWPNSEAAMEVVRSHNELAIDLVPSSVRDWLMEKANANDLKDFDAKTAILGLLIAARQNELVAWTNLAKYLAAIDESGQATSEVLATLEESGRRADAERLATILIAPTEATTVSIASREAACRWAGRTLRWSMLALASESENSSKQNPNRTVAIERLFAEALTQTGRVEDASAWWNSLVDNRKIDDFATLLRCAEAETSVGDDTAIAQRRIAAARESAGEDAFNVSLVDMLDAELAIRRTKFDEARSLLEKVVRSSETDGGLRGRAQFLIGETHYLQQEFAEAIEAYRRVEGIDSDGVWVAAALLQAGNSFEQLGRTREAAVCYGNLLSRFPDTPHAKVAGQRLASIAPDSPSADPSRANASGANPSENSSSTQTIRR